MVRTIKIALLCLAAYLLFLLANLPAAQVIPRLPLPAQLNIQDLSGTIWDGRARLVTYQGIPLNQVQWQLSPWGLLSGALWLELDAGNSRDAEQVSLKGSLVLGQNRVATDGLQLFLPTDLIIAQFPLPLPVNAAGRFRVQLDKLSYQDGCQELQGTGQWLNAQVAGTQGYIPLGNFEADLACQQQDLLINIREPNSFGLSAEARIPANFKIKVSGRFKPDTELPEEVHQAARLFGKPDAEGYYQIRF